MKHTWSVTLMLLALFVTAQLIGLGIIASGTHATKNADGSVAVAFDDPVLGERPHVTGFTGLLYILVGIAIGTAILLVLIRFHLLAVWKLWFFLAVWLALTLAIGTLIPFLPALLLSLALALWKIWRPNLIVHNVTEVLIYSGIAWLIVPLDIKLFYVTLLLIAIAIYDAYAVWRSKHMVAMAQFQTDSKLFAGLLIPYSTPKQGTASTNAASAKTVKGTAGAKTKKTTKRNVPQNSTSGMQSGRNAILGGGDIAFPLFFAGATFISLLERGFSTAAAYGWTLVVVGGATVALGGLFLAAKKDHFYPAMPFISAGCFVGYGVLWLIALA